MTSKKTYLERQSKGLCGHHGIPVIPGKKVCQKCIDKYDFTKLMQKRKSNKKWLEFIRARASLRYQGVTVSDEELTKFLENRPEICEICGQPPHGNGHTNASLHIDHDHKTGKLRGFLCQRCNRSLGSFDDDPELLDKAARYLRRIR